MDLLLAVRENPLSCLSKAGVCSFDIYGTEDYRIAPKMSRQIVISLDVKGRAMGKNKAYLGSAPKASCGPKYYQR
jgi:hypothetical protein